MLRRFFRIIPVFVLIPALLLAATNPDFDNLTTAKVSVLSDNRSLTHLSINTPQTITEIFHNHDFEYERSRLYEEGLTVKEGWPELPVVSRMVLVHPTAGIHVRINSIESRIEKEYKPYFVPPQTEMATAEIMGEMDTDYLKYDGWWPPEPISVSSPVIMRGNRLVSVSFFPMQVNPATGEVRHNDDIDFELVYAGDGENPVLNPDRPRPSTTFDRMIDDWVINPPRRDVSLPGRGCYLVVYNNVNGVLNAIQPLLNWRARQGWEVRTIAVQNQDASQVKTLIQRAYNDWSNPPEMLCIIGDATGSFPIGAWGGVTDFDFSQLDGNDDISDVHYGRISAEDIQTLERVIGRIVAYEADPYMQDVNWYRQGMVTAGSSTSGISTIAINRWLKHEARDRWGMNDIHEWYYNAPYQGQSVPTFFTNEYQRGIAISTYRGWIGMEGTDTGTIMNFRANQRMPVATIITCNTGTFPTGFSQSEAFLRSPGGAVGCVGMSTSSTHTAYNNCLFNGMWHAALRLNVHHFGAMVNWGRMEMIRHYGAPFNDGSYRNFILWCNLMGDPATHIWTGVPQLIGVTHDQTLPLGGSRVAVNVVLDANGAPLANANVCLYKAANNYQDVRLTDAEGNVVFNIPPDVLTAGDLQVTVSKHNIKPYLGRIVVGRSDVFVGASVWEVLNDDDNDGIANPGETFNILTTMTNSGSESIGGGLSVVAESESPWLEMVQPEAFIQDDLASGASANVQFTAVIDPSTPDGEALPITLVTSDWNSEWRSMIAIQARSPGMKVDSLRFIGGEMTRGAVLDMDAIISNRGSKRISAFVANAWTNTHQVSFIGREASYPALSPQQSSGAAAPRFRIRAHPFAIPGLNVTVYFALLSETGFRDTVSSTFKLGRIGNTDPIGPDSFGYICFDSGDEGWEQKPIYDWVEIDPNVQGFHFRGTDTRLSDGGNNQDQSAVFNLPTPLTHYGIEYDRITINTNGWVAFGDWSDCVAPRNRRLKSGGGPGGMMSVFWDDLATGRIFYYWDAPRQRFIVEWNAMTSNGGGVGPQTFEVIIHATGEVIYQYKEINNSSTGASPTLDTPYATVAFANPDNTDGIEYTYYNYYPPGARQLSPRMALKFTDRVQFITGALTGTVTDFTTGAPIAGAEVVTTRGFWAETDDNGRFLIDDILIGSGYQLTVSRQGYNDSTWAGFDDEGFSILEAETLFVDIALLHPEFNISLDRYEFQMEVDSTVTTGFMLSNDGNGTLSYTSRYTYLREEALQNNDSKDFKPPLRDEPDEQWDPLLIINAGNIVNDNVIQSIVYADDRWIIAGGNNREETNKFYIFDKNGEYIDYILQPFEGQYGIRDMEYYDGYLWCTTNTSVILKVDAISGFEEQRWSTPVRNFSPRNITINPLTGSLYVSALTGLLYQMDIIDDSLTVTRTFNKTDPRDNSSIREQGLAWFRDDPDGYNLYLISNAEPVPNPNAADVSIYKLNTETGDIIYLTNLPGALPASASGRGGMTITPKWNNRVWALAAVFDNTGGDLAGVFELAPNSSWMDYAPRSATLNAGEAIPIDLTVSTSGLDIGIYGVTIEFNHNAEGGRTHVPVNLAVVDSLIIPAVIHEPEIPEKWSLDQNYPNPFNSSTKISFSLKESAAIQIELFDLNGRLVSTLVDGWRKSGRHTIAIDYSDLPAGIYLYRLRTKEFTSTRKMLLVK